MRVECREDLGDRSGLRGLRREAEQPYPFWVMSPSYGENEAATCQQGSHHRSGRACRRCPGPRLRPRLCETQGAQHVEAAGLGPPAIKAKAVGGYETHLKLPVQLLEPPLQLGAESGHGVVGVAWQPWSWVWVGSGSGQSGAEVSHTERVVRGGEAPLNPGVGLASRYRGK